MIQFRDALKELKPYVPGKPINDVKREFGLENVIKLASNENPLGCSTYAQQAIIDYLSNCALYPDGNCTDLKNELSKSLHISPSNFILGCGTDEVIASLGKAFINEGDEAITASITFSQYAASVKSMGGKMIYGDMKDYGFDLDDILNKITNKTKIIFIANPNNPTGTILNAKEQEAFMKKVPSNILVVFDEAYIEYVDNENYLDSLTLFHHYKNMMVMRTFSKIHGLASLRVGYAIAHTEVIEILERIRNPFNVSAVAQVAAIASLRDSEFVNLSFASNQYAKKFIYDCLDELNLFYIPTEANFLMIDVKKDSRLMFQELMKKGYIIRPGAAFAMNNFIRVTIGTTTQMTGFITALKELL